MKVEALDFNGLTAEEKEDAGNNGGGREYANYIRITYNDGHVTVFSDAMDPEDATFVRDLSWVASEIRGAYEEGIDAANPRA